MYYFAAGRGVMAVEGSAASDSRGGNVRGLRRWKKKTQDERLGAGFGGVADGTRTHDNQNHNLGLYQLSYSHHLEKLAIVA